MNFEPLRATSGTQYCDGIPLLTGLSSSSARYRARGLPAVTLRCPTNSGSSAHELNSPLARLQYALAILEERADPTNSSYIADAQAELRLMSQLVKELLAFARAGIKGAEPQL